MAFAFIGQIIENSIHPHPALRCENPGLIRQGFIFFIEGGHRTLQGGQRQIAQIFNVLSQLAGGRVRHLHCLPGKSSPRNRRSAQVH